MFDLLPSPCTATPLRVFAIQSLLKNCGSHHTGSASIGELDPLSNFSWPSPPLKSHPPKRIFYSPSFCCFFRSLGGPFCPSSLSRRILFSLLVRAVFRDFPFFFRLERVTAGGRKDIFFPRWILLTFSLLENTPSCACALFFHLPFADLDVIKETIFLFFRLETLFDGELF